MFLHKYFICWWKFLTTFIISKATLCTHMIKMLKSLWSLNWLILLLCLTLISSKASFSEAELFYNCIEILFKLSILKKFLQLIASNFDNKPYCYLLWCFIFLPFHFVLSSFLYFSFFRPNNKLSTKFLFSGIPINSIEKNLNLYACDILFEAYWRRSIGKTISINIFYKFLVGILFKTNSHFITKYWK